MPRDLFYLSIIGLARTVFAAQGLKFTVSGWENVPQKGGAVVALNHTGYMDFTYAGIPFRKHKRFVRFMAKGAIFDHPIAGPMMRGMKHIPVDRIDGSKSYRQAVDYLKAGELVGVFPEATISRSFEIKELRSGAVRMAVDAQVPILPTIIFGSQRVWTKGHPKNLGRSNTPIHIAVLPPWTPTGDVAVDSQELREIMAEGLEGLIEQYQEREGALPKGAFWVPARFGGGAPTLAEAQREDTKVQEERYRVRRLNEDLDDLNEKITKTSSESIRQWWGRSSATLNATTEKMDKNIAELWATMRTNVEDLTEDVNKGLSEGAERITALRDQIQENMKQWYSQLPSGKEVLARTTEEIEQALHQISLQSRQIRDRLPHRSQARLSQLPPLISCDLDGTLLSSEGTILPETKEALHEAARAGTHIVFATGRPVEDIESITDMLGLKPQCVLANGAVLYDSEQGEVLDLKGIEQATCEEIVADLAENHPDCTVYWDYMDTDTPGVMERTVVKGYIVDPSRSSRELYDSIHGRIEDKVNVSWSSNGGIIEVSPLGITKGDGLKRLVERKGIDMGEVLAFGDMPNDIELLSMVGIGVAMGNAVPEVLRVARWVTASNDENGIADVIKPVLPEKIQEPIPVIKARKQEQDGEE